MTTAERILLAIIIACGAFLIWNMATDEGQHPLDDGNPQWVCFDGDCFDDKGGYKKM